MSGGTENYYWENGCVVLTAKFLLDRGFCCGNNCRHCPYEPKWVRTERADGRESREDLLD